MTLGHTYSEYLNTRENILFQHLATKTYLPRRQYPLPLNKRQERLTRSHNAYLRVSLFDETYQLRWVYRRQIMNGFKRYAGTLHEVQYYLRILTAGERNDYFRLAETLRQLVSTFYHAYCVLDFSV